MSHNIPPSGLRTESVWEFLMNRERVAEIIDAIARRRAEGKNVPNEWLDELVKRFNYIGGGQQ